MGAIFISALGAQPGRSTRGSYFKFNHYEVLVYIITYAIILRVTTSTEGKMLKVACFNVAASPECHTELAQQISNWLNEHPEIEVVQMTQSATDFRFLLTLMYKG